MYTKLAKFLSLSLYNKRQKKMKNSTLLIKKQ